METKTKKNKTVSKSVEVGEFFGKLYSYNNSLKLYHWHVTGKASYAQHMALDQALEDLADTLDRIVETSYAMLGDVSITIPQTKVPTDIIKHSVEFFDYVGTQRELFPEAFTQAIIDDYQEAIQQLLYRLKRLQ